MKNYAELNKLLNDHMTNIKQHVANKLNRVLPEIDADRVPSQPLYGINWYYNWQKMYITYDNICKNYFLRILGNDLINSIYADAIKNSLKKALYYVSSEKDEDNIVPVTRFSTAESLDTYFSPGVIRESLALIARDNYCSTKRYNPYALITSQKYEELSKDSAKIIEDFLPKLTITFKNLCSAKICTLREIHDQMLVVFVCDLARSQFFDSCDIELIKIVATTLFEEFQLIEDSFYRATSIFNRYDEIEFEGKKNKILSFFKKNVECGKFFESIDFITSMPDNFKAYLEQNDLFNRFVELYNNDIQQKFKTIGIDLEQHAQLVNSSHLTMSVSERTKLCKVNFLLEQKHLEKLDIFASDFARTLFKIYLQSYNPELEKYQKILEFTIKIDDIAEEFKEKYFESKHNLSKYFVWPNNRVKLDDTSDLKRPKYR